MMYPKRSIAFLALSALSVASPVRRVSSNGVSSIQIPVTKKIPSGLTVKDIVGQDKQRVSSFTAALASDETAPVVNKDIVYSVSTSVGDQVFDLIVDTGSGNTWVGAGTAYVKSSSGTSTNNTFSIQYGSGAVTGTEYIDKVTIGSASVNSSFVGAATTASGFNGYDGIFGLGPLEITNGTVSNMTTVPTFMNQLLSSGLISTEVLGVHFAPEIGSDNDDANGSLDLGGVDDTLYPGGIVYTPKSSIYPYSYYWGIDLGPVTFDGTTLLDSNSAIVDTGTTLIYIPDAAYRQFLTSSGGYSDPLTGLAAYSTPPTGTFSISIGSANLTLTPDQYLIPNAQYDNFGLLNGTYYAWINDGGTSDTSVDFVIGQKFIENYYSVFDTTNSRVGFAPSKSA